MSLPIKVSHAVLELEWSFHKPSVFLLSLLSSLHLSSSPKGQDSHSHLVRPSKHDLELQSAYLDEQSSLHLDVVGAGGVTDGRGFGTSVSQESISRAPKERRDINSRIFRVLDVAVLPVFVLSEV
jgi:hypothetical protein